MNTVATKSVELVVADGWSQTTTGSMNCPHYKPAILKMPNGKVLVTGNQYVLSKCIEIFDPVTKAFTRINDMALARKNPFLFNLSDGRVLILGGVQNKYPPSTTVYSVQPEIYDPSDGSFTIIETFLDGYSNHPWMPMVSQAIQMSDGRIFLLSGTTASAIFDPLTGIVIHSATTLYPRTSGAMAPLSDGRILLIGGDVSPTTAEVFDPSGTSRGHNIYFRESRTLIGTSTLLESSLTARRDSAVTSTVLSDGRFMFSGGRDTDGGFQSSVDIFDPATMQFMSTPPSMPMMRGSHNTVTFTDGTVMIFGGWAERIPRGTRPYQTKAVFMFDPATMQFMSTPPSMSMMRSFHNTVTFTDGTLMIFGGWTERIPRGTGVYQTKAVFMFDPATNTFTSGYGDLTTPRVNGPAVRLNDGTILIVGDDGNSGSPMGTNAWTAEIYTFE
jgi:hypothetical protein